MRRMDPNSLPVWRSLLYIPVTNDKFVAKAGARGADAIKIDLEDSIAPAEKARARTLVRDAARQIGDGVDILVRINRPWRMAVPDLEASVWPEVQGLCLPKVESGDHIRFIAEAVEELERERDIPVGSTGFFALIETPTGLFNVREIASASPRMKAISLGGEDFSAAIGLSTSDGAIMEPAALQVRMAAREAGILPIGYPGSIAEFTDLDAFERSAEQGRHLGYEGGSAIHPAQVPILNRAFSPGEEEVVSARDLVEKYEQAQAAGSGAIAVDGKMVDEPVVDRARRILSVDERIRQR